MNGASHPSRLSRLLADRALYGLTGGAQRELASLGGTESDGPDEFELAAAALHLALAKGRDPLPGGLRVRMEQQAAEWIDANPE